MMELNTQQVRVLAEIGLTAVGEGLFEDANLIAGALSVARPESEVPSIIRGLAALRDRRPGESLKIFEEGLACHPDSAMLGAYRGMALLAGGYQTQAEEALHPVCEQQADPSAAALARSLMPGRA